MNANTPSIQTAAGDVDTLSAAAKVRFLQNLGPNPLYVRMGTGASTSVFHFALAGGTDNDDGKGGLILLRGSDWAGILSVAGTSPRFVVAELE